MRTKQKEILEALKSKISFGKSLEEATREVVIEKRFNHLSVMRCAENLATDLNKLKKWAGVE